MKGIAQDQTALLGALESVEITATSLPGIEAILRSNLSRWCLGAKWPWTN